MVAAVVVAVVAAVVAVVAAVVAAVEVSEKEAAGRLCTHIEAEPAAGWQSVMAELHTFLLERRGATGAGAAGTAAARLRHRCAASEGASSSSSWQQPSLLDDAGSWVTEDTPEDSSDIVFSMQ